VRNAAEKMPAIVGGPGAVLAYRPVADAVVQDRLEAVGPFSSCWPNSIRRDSS
jgi:hypothetical protein